MINNYIFSINIPTSFELTTLKNIKNEKKITIILYNKTLIITFIKNINKIKLDLEFYSLKLKLNNTCTDNNIFLKNINNFLKTFEVYFFIKIKFKGKGFKIKFLKKLKIIKFFFGKSHITFFKIKRLKIKKINKYKFLLKSFNFNKLKKTAHSITYVKPVNVYTLRGIRISKQFIKKRKGKKSSYI